MKKWIGPLRRLASLPLIALCLAIGASEGGGGVTGTGSTACGSISDFGSIFVNGVEYFTDTANISIDGISGQAESQLRVGMVVRVSGLLLNSSTGQAASVDYSTDVRGAIDAAPVIGLSSVDFTVDGIPVHLGDRTFIDGASSATLLAAGDRVDVSGLRIAATGVIAASRVSRSALPGTILTGAISNVTATSFNLGSVLVIYDPSVLRGMASLAEGMTVRVRAAGDPVNGTLAASEIEPADAGLVAGSELNDQGVVASLASTSFYLGGLRVTYSSSTKFKNGTIANLQNGDVVEVEGAIAADGSLAAKQLSFEAFDAGRTDAVVVAKTTDGFMLISADGVQVIVTSNTRWKDRSALNQSNLNLSTLRLGDMVSVTGSETADGVITADNVTRLNPTPGVVLDGRARAADAGSIRELSIHALATGSTTYLDANGTPLTPDAFFAKVSGRRVTVHGVVSGSDVLVSSYQIDP